MADIDVWGLGGPIGAPSGLDRVPVAAGPNSGGYSLRSSFVWKGANDFFEAAGPNAAVRVIPNASTQWGGFEIYTGGQHEGSFKSQGSTGETRISSGRSVGWGGHVTIYTDTTEKVRIATNGNVGVGVLPLARLHVARSGPGEAIRFGSATYQMGYLGEDETSNTVIFGNRFADAVNCNISFRVNGAATEKLRITTNAVHAGNDNLTSSGRPSFRWDVVFAGTGAINTCDVRFKTFRIERGTTAAEHAAALECFDTFGFCQFNDAIALKGTDGARPHFVPGAQELWSIWAAHGLVEPLVENDEGELVPVEGSVPPAFLCFDKIEEERAPVMEGWRPSSLLGPDGEPIMVKCADGEEATEQRPTGETIVTREAGHIFGVRIDQIQSLMLAALNKERKAMAATVAAQEARLTALEPPA